ncbi:MAG: hypothetical protein IT320_18770 [Anaerolineae bacterium]|nr:hypothetical protein [Anaerolineae bacterium]
MAEKPRLLLQAELRRKPYWSRLPILVLGTIAASGAYWALSVAQRRGLADSLLLDVGRLVAVVLAGLLAVLTGLSFYRGLTRRNERIQIYDQGFVWKRGKQSRRYAWNKVNVFREGAGGVHVFNRPLLQWGSQQIVTRDGATYRFKPAHGDTRRFARAVRKYVGPLTSTRMGQMLRAERPIKIHPRLTVYPGGVEANGREIPWSQMSIKVRGNIMRIRQQQPNGKYKTVARFNTRRIDNLVGFLELAQTTIGIHTGEQRTAAATTQRSA